MRPTQRSCVPTYRLPSQGPTGLQFELCNDSCSPSSSSGICLSGNNGTPEKWMTSLNTASNPAFYGFQSQKFMLYLHTSVEITFIWKKSREIWITKKIMNWLKFTIKNHLIKHIYILFNYISLYYKLVNIIDFISAHTYI